MSSYIDIFATLYGNFVGLEGGSIVKIMKPLVDIADGISQLMGMFVK